MASVKNKLSILFIFIDYKSAYNTMLQDELHSALVHKDIANTDKENLIKKIYTIVCISKWMANATTSKMVYIKDLL